jgi:hypothetical protein
MAGYRLTKRGEFVVGVGVALFIPLGIVLGTALGDWVTGLL